QVRARADLLLPVVALRTLGVLHVEAEVVAQRIAAAGNARAVFLHPTRPEDRTARLALALGDVQRLDLTARRPPVVHRHTALGVHEPVRALRDRQRVARAARCTLLRDDVDHAARRLRAVQRRSRGTLQDLDALDVLGAEAVQTRDDARAESLDRDARPRLVQHADAVHVDERIARQRERRVAAHANGRARADHARTRHDHDTRRTAVDQL